MSIPRYWKKASQVISSDTGKKLNLTAWGWSDIGEAQALELAQTRLRDHAMRRESKLSPSEYPYPRTPLREEIVKEIGSKGPDFDVITRNRYGATVLNSSSLFFADIDLTQKRNPGPLSKLIGGLLGKNQSKSIQPGTEEWAMEKLEKFLSLNRGWGFRIYRTFAGLRYMAIHDRVPIGESGAVDVLKDLGSDPRYVKLCEIQKCYRARLSPKPWRCGFSSLTASYPYETKENKDKFLEWINRYESLAREFSTCRFLRAVGVSDISSELTNIVSLHDESTRALSELPLA